jgi:hypothetical protein
MLHTGGPAFPTGTGVTPYNSGMTLRDYFAAKAMQGIMTGQFPITRDINAEYRVSMAAYKLADAMLQAREQK